MFKNLYSKIKTLMAELVRKPLQLPLLNTNVFFPFIFDLPPIQAVL